VSERSERTDGTVLTATSSLSSTVVTTRRGIEATVLTGGPEGGTPVVAFHGFTGPLGGEPALVRLADAGFRVFAPVWPGYSETGGEGQIDDMLDFALHGADVVAALGLAPGAAHLIGHSMGGMIAAEMAALAPYGYGKVVLVDPLGLWLDEHPIPDIYSLLPYEFPPLLFHDEAAGTALLAGGGVDFSDSAAIQRFLIGNNRRLGTAGKILFPIPNRRLSKRLYRITNETLLLWGDDDRLLTRPYADAWAAALPHAERASVADAGHMAPYEQPDATAEAITSFLRA
jgi:pimeloyl-ACP methyl ester carboxylesterase